MKRIMMVGSALMMLSTSAFATQARLLALGMNETDNEGMYHISDDRNIFLNPAYVNLFPDRAVVDWGNTGLNVRGGAATSVATLNSNTAAPKAQGGVLKKYGDMVYGLWFGNESNTSSLLRIAGTSAASSVNGSTGAAGSSVSKMLQTADNQFDVFVGGDTGALKWGIDPTISFGKDESRAGKDSAYALRTGVIGSNWDVHANLSLGSKAEATETIANTIPGVGIASTTVSQKFDGKFGIHTGGSYKLDEKNRIFGYVKHYGWEQTDSFAYSAAQQATFGGQQGTVKGDFTSMVLGWGRDWDVNNGDKLFASLSAKRTAINLKFANKSEVRQTIIPLNFGYEAKATDWLTLRGSVIQNLWGMKDNKNIDNYSATGSRLNPVASATIKNIYGGSGKATVASSTSVNAGATIVLGQFTIDGLIGMTDTAGNSTISATNTNPPKTGVLSLGNLETSVGLTYKF